MAKLLISKEVNAKLNNEITERADALIARGITPTLAIVRVGEREDDISYERGAIKRCELTHVGARRVSFPEDVAEAELKSAVEALSKDASVHGILLLKPLPKHIDESAICEVISPDKDVDGATNGSELGIYKGSDAGFPPCTAKAVMRILEHYDIALKGKKAVVIGRSPVIGKPVSLMLLGKDATVTICHSKSEDVPAICKNADIIVAAAGVKKMVDASYVSAGQTIVDVGIHVGDDGKLCGDVDFDAVSEIVEAITPVPGGVGGVTTSILVSNVVEAAEKSIAK